MGLLLSAAVVNAQSAQELTVEKIMRDPRWIGTAPSGISWSPDSKKVYFSWNPENAPADSLYTTSAKGSTPQKVTRGERLAMPGYVLTNKANTQAVYEKFGDLYLLDIASGKVRQITNTVGRESAPQFSGDEKKIIFLQEQNLYSWEISTGFFTQLSDFKKGKKGGPAPASEQEKWLRKDQQDHFTILRERHTKQEQNRKDQKASQPKRPKEIYLDDQSVDMVKLSPNGDYITYRLTKDAKSKSTIVPNYVTASGFTEDIPARTKVGAALSTSELYLYDIRRDTVFQIKTDAIPGISDVPDYITKAAPAKTDTAKTKGPAKKTNLRGINFNTVSWSENGKYCVVVMRAQDNKDRWIMLLDVATQKLSILNRQHDEAWIGGPGSASFGEANIGWLADNKSFWFFSEESGYAHLYVVDVTTGARRAVTQGEFEVQNAQLSRDKNFFYIITNEVHPGEKQFYKIPVTGGKATRLTTMTGAHEVELSPDEKTIAFRYSYSNKPWELFIMENKAGAQPRQVTQSLSAEFKAYPWRDPQVVTIKARDGEPVYARLYKPKQPNGAAVVFVHGAGYLQNAHKWWSNYFREYMFHNLLVDKGYTVLDIDYRGSAGYGRNWRTGIYRHMGGKDLTDHVDAAQFLATQHGIDPKRMGVYGGSYGGFITLMAMFTTPDVFAAGAALRPVTDWAHYNHGYTANILNTPQTDSLAYAKSSPLYYADGLKGSLLICHGMVDVNVHFQDVVRLSQRLIELGKNNWELAVYPMEDHGFVEPSSWTDEYKRILKLFEEKLK